MEKPSIHFYFNLFTTTTSVQRQRPLKHVRTARKKTSRQRPGNRLLTNGEDKTTLFSWKRSPDLISTARRWSLGDLFLFSFCLIDIFCALRIYGLKDIIVVFPETNRCRITTLPPHNGHCSNGAAMFAL